MIAQLPVDGIDVLNSRSRDEEAFAALRESMERVGLKKPITVTRRGDRYLLICGEGRLRAARELGWSQIPARVREVSDDDALVMSLVENIARRRATARERLEGFRHLLRRGDGVAEIAAKTGLSTNYVYQVLNLIEHGEDLLLAAVEDGRVGIEVAMQIVEAGQDDARLQEALHEAYERGELNGKSMREVCQLLKQRSRHGKKLREGSGTSVTSRQLVRDFQREVERQRLMVQRADLAQQRLLLAITAMKRLLADEDFVTLLRAEHLNSVPQFLAERAGYRETGK